MKTASLWIIRVALAVQFLGVLAVPALVAAAESLRGRWMAEWLRPQLRSDDLIITTHLEWMFNCRTVSPMLVQLAAPASEELGHQGTD